ncbi:MAG: HD domain-containing phosphohydrolase, partial [Pyrinomonadaceae bacterium]
MPQGSLKSIALVIGATAFAVCAIAISLLDYTIPAAGDLVWISLLLLSTVAAGRFKLSLTNADGNNQSQNTLAVAFIFLGGMLYGIPAAALLAAIDSLLATRHERNRRIRVFSVSAAIVSIWLALTIYQLLLQMLTGGSVAGGGVLPFGSLFLPMAALALVQYALNTLVTTAFVAFETGKARLVLSRESFVWTATAQLAGASSAALFYAAWQGSGLSYLFVGAIITPLVYLLYRFNAQHVAQVRRAQAEQLRHVEEIAALHMNTIESLAIANDAKDHTTHGHVRRTQIYALELGKILGVSESELMALRAGALLHDVGKLAVPEYILNKPGKLTAAEFEKMKIHTVVGGDIIKRVNFPYPVEEIVRFHHEKWDGSGYPKGLREAQIPLVARIISVVDFYDATRCDRPYRVGMKREEALGLLRRMAGNSFDPRVVETFIANIEFFDRLIAEQGIQEQVTSEDNPGLATARPDAGLASDVLGAAEDEHSSLGKLVEAQRELLALHEISQTIGSSLNLQDTLTLVAGKLRAILPYDTCAIYLVDERTCKATALHVAGTHAEIFAQRRITVGEG